ncbi:MAG: dihydroxyacetone kinase subunit DhaK [Peptococcaceae bacterium]|nr:dihydroxyacetone kinase subunit DhaK [Peptococcaceae bacterium]
MKKFLNKPENIVREMCRGIVLAHPELELLPRYKIIKRGTLNAEKVSLISGGGSGHEPAHAGFVGAGMLDAAVCGDVFASPSQIQVYQAIRAVTGNKGALLVIKNYSGDLMNFQNGVQLALEDGIDVDYVKVDDDVAVRDSLYTVGRRGVAGTVFVHKIAGAAAEEGRSLPEVKAVAERVIANVKSIGIALTSCTVPAKGTPTFSLAENEMEYGVGIHGEPGVRRETLQGADALAGRMVSALCSELGLDQAKGGRRAALMINGFGATPLMELYLLNGAVARELRQRDIAIARTFVGNYMTSIDMAGASVSLLRLDDELETLLSMPCEAPGFKVSGSAISSANASVSGSASGPANYMVSDVSYSDLRFEESGGDEARYEVETPVTYARVEKDFSLENMIYLVDAISASCIRNEVAFCELDSRGGDGDFGMSVAKGFRELKRQWKRIISTPGLTIGSFLTECSFVIMEHCGGASGPIWGSAFRAAGKRAGDLAALSVKDLAAMLGAVVDGIRRTGERSFGRGAVIGDKTLIDALAPCADAWAGAAEAGAGFEQAFAAGARAAAAGAESTKEMIARMGRASNVGERSLGYPDAGAYAVGIIFTEIAGLLSF